MPHTANNDAAKKHPTLLEYVGKAKLLDPQERLRFFLRFKCVDHPMIAAALLSLPHLPPPPSSRMLLLMSKTNHESTTKEQNEDTATAAATVTTTEQQDKQATLSTPDQLTDSLMLFVERTARRSVASLFGAPSSSSNNNGSSKNKNKNKNDSNNNNIVAENLMHKDELDVYEVLEHDLRFDAMRHAREVILLGVDVDDVSGKNNSSTHTSSNKKKEQRTLDPLRALHLCEPPLVAQLYLEGLAALLKQLPAHIVAAIAVQAGLPEHVLNKSLCVRVHEKPNKNNNKNKKKKQRGGNEDDDDDDDDHNGEALRRKWTAHRLKKFDLDDCVRASKDDSSDEDDTDWQDEDFASSSSSDDDDDDKDSSDSDSSDDDDSSSSDDDSSSSDENAGKRRRSSKKKNENNKKVSKDDKKSHKHPQPPPIVENDKNKKMALVVKAASPHVDHLIEMILGCVFPLKTFGFDPLLAAV